MEDESQTSKTNEDAKRIFSKTKLLEENQ